MTYRDDLEAAQARIEQLEQERDDARHEADALRHARAPVAATEAEAAAATPAPERGALARAARPGARPAARSGKIHFDPPATYFPLLLLERAAMRAAWRRVPRLGAIETDNLALLVLHRGILRPVVNFVYAPVYAMCLALVVMPWSALAAGALSLLLLPVIALARTRVGPPRGRAGEGWPQGDFTEQEGAIALWVLLAVTMAPMLPVFIPLMNEKSRGN